MATHPTQNRMVICPDRVRFWHSSFAEFTLAEPDSALQRTPVSTQLRCLLSRLWTLTSARLTHGLLLNEQINKDHRIMQTIEICMYPCM